MRIILSYLRLLLILLLISGSCKKKETDPQPLPTPTETESGIWVLNEGNFQAGNASLSFFDITKNEVTHNVFKNANGRPIGDVLYSMCEHGGKYYLVVNNSQKIEVASADDMKTAGVIEGFNSPRFMLPVGGNKAYVSDLYEKGIWIVDLAQNKISGKIPYREGSSDPFIGWTEQMALLNNKAYILAVKAGQLLAVDIATDKIVDSLNIGTEPQWMIADKENKLWILTNGSLQGKPSHLFRVDPEKMEILNSIEFSSASAGPSHLLIDGDWLYYLDQGIYRMNITAPALPASPFIAGGDEKTFYAIGIKDNYLFASDALDYIKRGKVYYYDLDDANAAPGSFEAGLIPGRFYGGE